MAMEVFLALYYFVLSFVLVFVILLISPLFLFRFFVSAICPLVRPDLGKIVSPRTAVHAIDDLHNNPKNSELLFIVVEGPLDINDARKIMVSRIERNKLNGLKSYFVKWCGYFFWKKDVDFDIKNHLYYYEDDNFCTEERVTEEQLYEKHNYYLTRPFAKNRSPWELILVKNYQPKNFEEGKSYSAYIFQVHHSLGDGYGLLSAYLDVDTFHLPQEKKYAKRSPNYIFNSVSSIASLLTAPYNVVKYYHECVDRNSPFIMKNRSGNYHTGVAKLSVDIIDKIKVKFGASFTSVYLAAITAGIRSFLLENKLPIPSFIHVLFPLPVPGAYEPLSNKITFVFVKLPVGMADCEDRLHLLTKQFVQLKKSPFSQVVGFIPLIAGSLPSFFIKPIIQVKYVSGVTSNFPGPSQTIELLNGSIVDWCVSGNLMGGYPGMAFANISYKRSSTVVFIGDQSIFKQKSSVEKIMENLKLELEILNSRP